MTMNESVLITGGTRRLGFAMARKSLNMGYNVILHYRSDRREAETWLRKHPEFCPRVTFIQSELTEHPEKLFDAAYSVSRDLVGLVNNASIFTPGDISNRVHYRKILETNCMVPLKLTIAFRSRIKKGWIINITDAHVRPASRKWQNYRISKRVLQRLTYRLALALAPRIRVNAIAPGAMLPARGSDKREFAGLARQIPLQRTGDIGSLLKAYEYLVTAEYVTGQTLYVDGGWHLV